MERAAWPRGEAARKRELVMSVLERLDWFAQYQSRVHAHLAGRGRAPRYPAERMQRVERFVEMLLRDMSAEPTAAL